MSLDTLSEQPIISPLISLIGRSPPAVVPQPLCIMGIFPGSAPFPYSAFPLSFQAPWFHVQPPFGLPDPWPEAQPFSLGSRPLVLCAAPLSGLPVWLTAPYTPVPCYTPSLRNRTYVPCYTDPCKTLHVSKVTSISKVSERSVPSWQSHVTTLWAS